MLRTRCQFCQPSNQLTLPATALTTHSATHASWRFLKRTNCSRYLPWLQTTLSSRSHYELERRHTSNTAHSILFDAVLSRPRLAATIAAGAYGIAYLAALTYYAYVTAHSLHATAKPPPPAYVPIYHIFRTVVERTASLCQQRRWL